MTALSMTAEETIETAKLAFSLGMISQGKLEYVVAQAERNPSYNPIMDLPFPWEIRHEEKLRRRARRPRWLRWLP